MQRVTAMMAYVVSEGRLCALKPAEWSLLLTGVALCGIATLLFLMLHASPARNTAISESFSKTTVRSTRLAPGECTSTEPGIDLAQRGWRRSLSEFFAETAT